MLDTLADIRREIIQVRDVPAEDAEALRARATARKMSLSSYLRELIHDDIIETGTASYRLAHTQKQRALTATTSV